MHKSGGGTLREYFDVLCCNHNFITMNTSPFFDSFFNTAKQNAIMILDEHGIVLKVNKAFTDAFGYLNEDITEQNFRLTFIDKDRKMNKPEMELQTVKSRGSAEDENYIL